MAVAEVPGMRYPKLRYANRQGFPIASDAVVMCFYFQHAHNVLAPAVIRAIDILRGRSHPYPLEWSFDPEGQGHPLDEAEWETIRRQMLEEQESAVILLSGAPEVGGLLVDYRGLRCFPLPWSGREHDVSALFMLLPTEYLEAYGPGQVRELALEMAEAFPFASGYVGLALDGGGPDGEAAALVRSRYPGMHMTRGGPDIRVGTHVDGVHWMNFLGQPVLGKLGGISGLREHLSLPGISIQDLGNERVVITLGDAPNPGDTEAGETLPLHRALARLLEPHLYRNTRPLGRMTPEDMRRWERRFLD